MPARRWRRDRRMMGVGQLNAGDARALRRGRVTARGRNKRAAKIAARAMMGAARNATAGTLQVDLQMGVITALIGPAATGGIQPGSAVCDHANHPLRGGTKGEFQPFRTVGLWSGLGPCGPAMVEQKQRQRLSAWELFWSQDTPARQCNW